MYYKKLLNGMVLLVICLFVLTINQQSTLADSVTVARPEMSEAEQVDIGQSPKDHVRIITFSAEEQATALEEWTQEAMRLAQPVESPTYEPVADTEPVDDIPQAGSNLMPQSVSGMPPASDANMVAQDLFPEAWSDQADVSVADISAEEHGNSFITPLNLQQTIPFDRYSVTRHNTSIHTKYPYTTIGKLFFHDSQLNLFSCTATVIRPSIIITAAHCVFDTAADEPYQNFLFFPAIRDSQVPYQSFMVEGVSYLADWEDQARQKDDVALLRLGLNNGQPVEYYTGYLGYELNASYQQHLHTLGYPHNIDAGEHLTACVGQSTWQAQFILKIGCDMSGGISGGAMIKNFTPYGHFGEANDLKIVGVVSDELVNGQPELVGPQLNRANFGELCAQLASTDCLSTPSDTSFIIDDGVPAGATEHGLWQWLLGTAYSGDRAHYSQPGPGFTQHYLTDLHHVLKRGDTVSTMIYIPDIGAPPNTIMIQVHDGGSWKRVHWGDAPAGFSSNRMGPLPEIGEWVRLSARLSDFSGNGIAPNSIMSGIAFGSFNGSSGLYWDYTVVGKDAPTPQSGFVIDEHYPIGSTQHGNNLPTWDDTRARFGNRSRHVTNQNGWHQHYLWNLDYVLQANDRVSTWIYLDPINTPNTVMFQVNDSTSWKRVHWGVNASVYGPSTYIGPLPQGARGGWVRLSASLNKFSEGGLTVGNQMRGFAFSLSNGEAWWDYSTVGKDATTPPPGLVINDNFPVGSTQRGDNLSTWDTSQSRAGTQSRHVTNRNGWHQHYLKGLNYVLQANDTVSTWIYLHPTRTPNTVMFQVHDSTGWKRVHWGVNVPTYGPSIYMGPLPEGARGGWVRLSANLNQFSGGGLTVGNQIRGFAFSLSNGEAWWDYSVIGH